MVSSRMSSCGYSERIWRQRQHGLGARQVEQVHAHLRGVGEHARLVDRQPLREWRAALAVLLQRRQPEVARPAHEELDQLGVLAVEAEREPGIGVVVARRGHGFHDPVEVAEVVLAGHRVRGRVRGVGREVEALVEEVVLEARHPGLRHEPGDLVHVAGVHRRDVEAVVGVAEALHLGEQLREDLPVGAGLVQVVVAGAEVRHDRGGAAHQRGLGLARGVLGERAVDAHVVVGVHRAGHDQEPARVDLLVGVRGHEVLRERSDAAVLDADRAAHHALAGEDDLPSGDDRV